MPIDTRTLVAYISEWLGVIAVAWIFSINPALRRPLLGFLYPRREALFAFGLGAGLIAAAVFSTFFFPARLPSPLIMGPAPLFDLLQALIFAAVALLAAVAMLLLRGQPIRSIGWDPALLRPALQVGFASMVLSIFLRNRLMNVMAAFSSPNLYWVLLAVGIGLAEETVFRGYMQPRISAWIGNWQGILVSSLFFTAWHVAIVYPFLPAANLGLMAGLTLVQGLVCGWVMRKTGSVAVSGLYRGISIWLRLI